MDGLSWRIGGMSLQTPILAARVSGTHPFKWDGGDANLNTSLTQTVKRLGGSGITESQALDIASYLKSLPAPRAPTAHSHEAVARGGKLFYSDTVGCGKCHSGPAYTNGKSYSHLTDDLNKVDTPSLIGLAQSAPYYHDGSATTLKAVLMGRGSIHGMGRTGHLKAGEISDLVAFLNTL